MDIGISNIAIGDCECASLRLGGVRPSQYVANLLLEDGGDLLLEDGGYFLLETQTVING